MTDEGMELHARARIPSRTDSQGNPVGRFVSETFGRAEWHLVGGYMPQPSSSQLRPHQAKVKINTAVDLL